jgi:hypothetical protein
LTNASAWRATAAGSVAAGGANGAARTIQRSSPPRARPIVWNSGSATSEQNRFVSNSYSASELAARMTRIEALRAAG